MTHERWMHEAIRLAEKGIYDTSSNPMVGAVVVRKNQAVGKGFHKRYGGPHAEVIALQKAGAKAKDASLYVTLEPCSTWGKTPPCVSAILQAGIREVVIGTLDPNPKNHGKGMRALLKGKIRVWAGVLSNEVQKQNEAFFKYVRTGLPFVTLKMAQSLDGKIATRTGRSRWISSPASRDFVHDLRARQDAILIGKNTLEIDNPLLSPSPYPFPTSGRGQGEGHKKQFGKPWRIALDPDLEAPTHSRIFQGDQITFLAISEKNLKSKKFSRKKTKAVLLPVKEKKGRLDLRDLFKKIAEFGVAKLLVEGGGELAWSLFKEGLVDKAYWIVAPKIIGGRNAKTSVEGDGVEDPSKAFPCEVTSCRKLGEDWLFELEPKKQICSQGLFKIRGL